MNIVTIYIIKIFWPRHLDSIWNFSTCGMRTVTSDSNLPQQYLWSVHLTTIYKTAFTLLQYELFTINYNYFQKIKHNSSSTWSPCHLTRTQLLLLVCPVYSREIILHCVKANILFVRKIFWSTFLIHNFIEIFVYVETDWSTHVVCSSHQNQKSLSKVPNRILQF